MDDESGWHTILVEGWGDPVRDAVCDRVDDALAAAHGVLAIAVVTPDGAPAAAVERVHHAVVAAIAAETGADLDLLGSQAAWATYEDVWGELTRRWADGGRMELLRPSVQDEVLRLLTGLPPAAVEQAGAVRDGDHVQVLRTTDGVHLDVEGLSRWLATATDATETVRARARRVVEVARRRTP